MFKRKKEESEMESVFNQISMWKNLPDSTKKLGNLAQLYEILSRNMALLQNKQIMENNFIIGGYSPNMAAQFYQKQKKYYRKKFYNFQASNPTGVFVVLPSRHLNILED